MKDWSVLEKVLAAVAVLVFVGVGALGLVAWRSGDGVPDGCEVARDDSDIEGDMAPTDALRVFVQARSDEFPVDDSWILESDDDGVYTFVSEADGYYEVDVRDGLVRRFMTCPDGNPDR
ncbi:MAG: hypothetical protein ACLFRV_04525 [Acidimicrobiales bacterium]